MTIKCFYCEKEVSRKLPYRMVPLEVPYFNAFFHKECLDIVSVDFPDTYDYIRKNLEKITRFIENSGKK